MRCTKVAVCARWQWKINRGYFVIPDVIRIKMKRRAFIQSGLVTPLILAGCQNQDAQTPESLRVPIVDSKSAEQEIENEQPTEQEQNQMYGIIGKMNATEGNREKLIDILINGTKDMPGCRLYAIAADTTDENAIWITELRYGILMNRIRHRFSFHPYKMQLHRENR